MKWCLIHEMLGCIYAYLVLEVGLRDLDNSFHISYHLYRKFLGLPISLSFLDKHELSYKVLLDVIFTCFY